MMPVLTRIIPFYQLTLDNMVLIFLSIASLGLSIGLFISFIYFLKTFVNKFVRERPAEQGEAILKISSEVSSLGDKLSQLEREVASIKKETLPQLQDTVSQVAAKASQLETKLLVLERRVTREISLPRPVSPVTKPQLVVAKEVELSKLSDLSLHFPEVRFACIITSQGYLVESYGQSSEEPAKLLDVLRLYNSQNVSLTRGRRRLEVFYLGDVRDLSVYGVLEFSDLEEVTRETVEAIKRAISKYFTDVVGRKSL